MLNQNLVPNNKGGKEGDDALEKVLESFQECSIRTNKAQRKAQIRRTLSQSLKV